jgi:hypothetical protein
MNVKSDSRRLLLEMRAGAFFVPFHLANVKPDVPQMKCRYV